MAVLKQSHLPGEAFQGNRRGGGGGGQGGLLPSELSTHHIKAAGAKWGNSS